jgi:hypothetical protein
LLQVQRVDRCTDVSSKRQRPLRLEVIATGPAGASGIRMNHTWYVTFEVPKNGTLLLRRNPRLTKTFETEAEAKDFARTKFKSGLVVTAGTIIPHLPRRAIPSEEIPAWLESGPAPEPGEDAHGQHGPTTKTD